MNTPARIKSEVGDDAIIIFILREPIDRLVSWYSFSKQIGVFKDGATFIDFLEIQSEDGDYKNVEHQYELALEQGKYLNYLNRWYEHFDESKIKIYHADDLLENTSEVIKDVCLCADLDYGFYCGQKFNKENVTKKQIHKL